jgi:phytoene desaturase
VPRQAVVVGAGLGGLSAAAHLCSRGWQVLVLEQRDSSGGKAASLQHDGYRLDPGPSIVILTEVYRRLFESCGRRMEDWLRFERLDPVTRVFWEPHSGPIDLPAEAEDCVRVLGDVAPDDADPLRDLLRRLDTVAEGVERVVFERPIQRPWQLLSPDLARVATAFDVRKTYRELVDGFFRSPLLRAFFYGFPSYNGQTYDSKAAGALLIPYYMFRRGVWWPVGGVGAIPRAVEALARDLGAEIRHGCRVTGLVVDRGRVRGVQTVDGTIQADVVVCNADRLTVAGWLGRPVAAKPSLSYFTLNWGVRRPLGALAHHTLWVPERFEPGFDDLYRRRRPPTDPVVYFNDTTAHGTAPAGSTNLFAVVTTPACEPGLDWDAEGDRLESAVRRALDKMGCGISDGEIDFVRRQDPRTFRDRDGNFHGTLYGPEESARLWGLVPLRNMDERVRGLYYVGGSVQPGAGMPMVTLSGKFVADLLGDA